MRSRARFALLCALAIVSAPSGAVAATFFVGNSGTACSNTGSGTLANPYCSISAALAARHAAGTTIVVLPGTYHEQVTLPASGTSGSPITLRAQGTATDPVVVDGADDLANPALWVIASGSVWRAASVTWSPNQVFADGARLAPSTAAPASLPAGSFTWVSGSGLFVNLGGDNPGSHHAEAGRRNYGFYVSGHSWVVIDGFTTTRTEFAGIELDNLSSQVTVTHCVATFSNNYGIQANNCTKVLLAANTTSDNLWSGLALIGGSTGCTVQDNESFHNLTPNQSSGLYDFGAPANLIQRNRLHDNAYNGIMLSTGATNNILVQNRSWNNAHHGIEDIFCTGNAHVGDISCGNAGNGFAVEGGATGTTLFDCVATDNGPATFGTDLEVDASSVVGFNSNDNLFWNSASRATVKFGATNYLTVASYSAANSKDTRSLQADPKFVNASTGDFRPRAGSPLIDSGNSGVANWPATDAAGHARVDDPATANTGRGSVTFADRGALEFVPGVLLPNQPPVAALAITPGSGTVPLAVSADGSGSFDPERGRIGSYRFDFGDGTVVGPQPGAKATHTYIVAGNWAVTLTVTDSLGLAGSASLPVSVAPPPPPTTGTWYVSNSGPACADAGPGTQANPYCSISAALAAQRAAGTTIVVLPGTYHEQVTLPVSGTSANPITLQAQGTATNPVVVDGADDLANPALWVISSGSVWRAASVTWSPNQVFADGARLTPSTAAPASLPAGSFTWVSGSGLFVNLGGDNPGSHHAEAGRRNYGFYVSGHSWVVIDGFTTTRTEFAGIELDNLSSQVTVTHCVATFSNNYGIQANNCTKVLLAANTTSDNLWSGLALIGGSTGCTVQDNESFHNLTPNQASGLYDFGAPANLIQRNRLHDNAYNGLMLSTGATNNILVQNRSWNNAHHGIEDIFCTGNAHVGDVSCGNAGNGFAVEGNATGTTLFDCVATDNGPASFGADLEVDASSVSGFSANDNLFWNTISRATVKYAGTPYLSVASYSTASGQDTRTLQADPRFVNAGTGDFRPLAGSPLIDSGNSGVANWPASDAAGHVRIDDPATANTGRGSVTFADRGALEFLSGTFSDPGGTSGVDSTQAGGHPHGTGLAPGVAPNPVRGSASFGFRLDHAVSVRIHVFDLGGRLVRTLPVPSRVGAGWNVVALDGRADDGAPLPSGIYLYEIRAGAERASGRFVVMR